MKLDKIKAGIPSFLRHYASDAERLKWQAVETFQQHWDPVAEDFNNMWKQSIDDDFTSFYWKNRPKHFKEAVSKMANQNRKAVQQAFQDLFYSRVNLASRIEHFMDDMEQIFKPLYHHVDLTVKDHGHDQEVIFMYLACSAPQQYPFYRRSDLTRYLEYTEARNKPEEWDWEEQMKAYHVALKVLNTQAAWKEGLIALLGEVYDEGSLIPVSDFMAYIATEKI